jgi:type I restriction enzyme S subunit
MSKMDTGLHYPIDLSVLPDNWCCDYVGAVAETVQSGFACGAHNRNSDGVAHVRPMNISRAGRIDLSDLRFVPTDYDDRRLDGGDVLFNNTNSPELVGKTAHIGKDAAGLAFSNHMTRIRFSPAVDPLFAAIQLHYLWSMKYFLHRCVKHVNQASVSSTDVAKSVPFVVPPLSEQRRIANKLDELFSELDAGAEALTTAGAQLKAYRQSVLKHAFEGKLTEGWRKRRKEGRESPGKLLSELQMASASYFTEQVSQWQIALQHWERGGEKGKRPSKPERPAEVVPVSDTDIAGLPSLPDSWAYVRLATLAQIGSGMSVSKDRVLNDPVEVPYLRVANVQRGRLDLTQIAKMRVEKSQLSQLVLKKWDVLFNEGGDRDKLGRGWVWEDQLTPCITQNHVFRASPYMASEPQAKFLSYWGNTFGQGYFNTEGKQTTNLASINKAVLSSFPVPLPSMREQSEIVSEIEGRLSLADGLLSEIDAALERHNVLRQSILKVAFSGQLVGQDPKDEPASALLERIRAERRDTTMKKERTAKSGRKEAA